jgi:hypothetical protein
MKNILFHSPVQRVDKGERKNVRDKYNMNEENDEGYSAKKRLLSKS